MIGIGFFNISVLALRCLGWGHGGVRLFQYWLFQLVLYAAWRTRANYLPCSHWKAPRHLSWSTAPAPSGCAMVQLTTVLYKACHGGHLTIHLALGGCTKWPFYHIVVFPNKCPKDGHLMEQLGSYDPMSNNYGKKLIALNLDQMWHCIGCGAHLSKPVENFVGLSGYFPQHLMVVTNAERLWQKQAW